MGPLLTQNVHATLRGALRAHLPSVQCSLDLERSMRTVELSETGWICEGQLFPWLDECKDRTIYHWTDASFRPIARYATSLIKLVPSKWGAPTFEIDGIKMLPTEKVSPYADARRKVGLIQPLGKVILDTCGGLGYFAAWCMLGKATRIFSYEINPDVIWLRSLNPWSPEISDGLTLTQGDIANEILSTPSESIDAILHDPPRFGIAGELYSQVFYDQLARVLKRRGRLFHYTGTPNKLTSGRDVPNEVATRLKRAGFRTQMEGDGVLAVGK
jgi:uncharacterized protein